MVILMQLAVGWFDLHTLFNQIAALVLCNFSSVFTQGCATFACRTFINFKCFKSRSDFIVGTYKQRRLAVRLPRGRQQSICKVTPTLCVNTAPVLLVNVLVLGAFAKLRKAAISFVTYVRLPAPCNNSAPTGRIFKKFYISILFETQSGKFKNLE